MVSVQQISGCIRKRRMSIALNMKTIANILKIAMSNIAGVADLLNNLNETVELVCETTSSENKFIKAELSKCGTMLIGISMFANSSVDDVVCFQRSDISYHYKLISAQVDKDDHEQVADVKKFFDAKFNSVINDKPMARRPPSSPSLCMPSIEPPMKIKEYELPIINDDS